MHEIPVPRVQVPNNWSVKSDQLSKGVIFAYAEATYWDSFNLKIFPRKFC